MKPKEHLWVVLSWFIWSLEGGHIPEQWRSEERLSVLIYGYFWLGGNRTFIAQAMTTLILNILLSDISWRDASELTLKIKIIEWLHIINDISFTIIGSDIYVDQSMNQSCIIYINTQIECFDERTILRKGLTFIQMDSLTESSNTMTDITAKLQLLKNISKRLVNDIQKYVTKNQSFINQIKEYVRV